MSTVQTFPIVLVTWTESERGWGTRPDGVSIHLSLADQKAFATDFSRRFNNLSVAPDEYTRCDNNPTIIDAEPELYEHLQALRTKGEFGCFAAGQDEAWVRRGKCPWGPHTYSVWLPTGAASRVELFDKLALQAAKNKADALHQLEVETSVMDTKGNIVYSPAKDKPTK